MARPFNRSYRSRAIVGSPALAAETTICQIGNVSTDGPSQVVILNGWVAFTVGATGTAIRLRVRQGSLTGTVVADTGALTAGIAAAALVAQEVQDFDSPGDVDAMAYLLTLQVTGGSSVSTVSATNLVAITCD